MNRRSGLPSSAIFVFPDCSLSRSITVHSPLLIRHDSRAWIGLGPDPEVIGPRLGGGHGVLGQPRRFGVEVAEEVAARELVLLDLVVPPGVPIHRRPRRLLPLDPDPGGAGGGEEGARRQEECQEPGRRGERPAFGSDSIHGPGPSMAEVAAMSKPTGSPDLSRPGRLAEGPAYSPRRSRSPGSPKPAGLAPRGFRWDGPRARGSGKIGEPVGYGNGLQGISTRWRR